MQMTRLTRQGCTQQNIGQVQSDNKIIAQFVGAARRASSTHAVTQRQTWKTLKQVQGLSNFTTAHGFTHLGSRSGVNLTFAKAVQTVGLTPNLPKRQHGFTHLESRSGVNLTFAKAVQTCRSVKGFTLIELLVVVLIIGILAAVALPQYNKAVTKSRAVQLQTLLDSVAKASEAYYLQNGRYPVYLSDLDLDISLPITNTYPNPAKCLGAWVPSSLGEGKDFQITLYDGGVGQRYRLAAYFTTGKYKCTGFSYFLDDKVDKTLNHKSFCTEGYHNRSCGTNCEIGIFCQEVMGKKQKKYHETTYLYE